MAYEIELTTNALATQTLYLPYHYLSDQSRTHRPAQLTYGLTHSGRLVGACAFAGFPVAELFKGIFGIEDFRNYDQSGFHELSRLCIHPDHQQEKGLASWFASRCLKRLKAHYAADKRPTHDGRLVGRRCRAVLSYADDEVHSGVIYAATNFKYYGLSAPKFNIWLPWPEHRGGKYLPEHKRPGRSETHWKQMSRGWREHLDNGGIKVPRGQKHRFLLVWDRQLQKRILWPEQKWSNNRSGMVINTHPQSTNYPLSSDAVPTLR